MSSDADIKFSGDLYGAPDFAELSFNVTNTKDIFKKKKKFAVKVLTSPFPFSGPATVSQDTKNLSQTGIDSKYVFIGRIMDRKMVHEKLCEDPCDEATAPDARGTSETLCLHTQITLTKAGAMPTFDVGDVLICKFSAGQAGAYNYQNAEFVRVKDSFKTKRITAACEDTKSLFKGTNFGALGQMIPAGSQVIGSSFGTSTSGGGFPMLTSAQSCGDTEPAPADWAETTLYYVISKKEKSKKYTDVIPLDGGSIGIAHFASSGIYSLYDAMGDTIAQKYFGRSVSQLKSFSRQKNDCKGSTPMSENDNGTGCYSVSWWKSGMKKFTAGPESKRVQTAAWMSSKAGPASEKAKSMGWVTGRQFAIAAGISNSLGVGGFTKLATSQGWDAEKTLIGYVNGLTIPGAKDSNKRHWQRRADVINSTWPCKNIISATPPATASAASGSATEASGSATGTAAAAVDSGATTEEGSTTS